MKVTILPGKIRGEISAIPSKSHLHRLLIYSSFADKDTFIVCADTRAEDITATIDCLSALGAVIKREEEGFNVTPVDRNNLPMNETVIFPCGESGSTLRFLLPVVNALGICGAFHMKGRLPQRPLAPLDEQLANHGVVLWRDDPGVLHCKGKLVPADDYRLPGDISSQYVSGLLMGLALLDSPSRITIISPLESAGYVEMTVDVASAFKQTPEVNKNLYKAEYNTQFTSRGETEYTVRGGGVFKSPGRITAEGDWSNSAFWLCAGAMPRGNIAMKNLSRTSSQGDKEIYNILSRIGANIVWEDNAIFVKEAHRNGAEIDCKLIPDLIPVLAAVAAVGTGTTVFTNASRLRIKESDRLMSTAKTLQALGANIREVSDGLEVIGVESLRGGTVNSMGDHRIAMMAAVASTACHMPVVVVGAEAVNKSYPNFWKDLNGLGKKAIEE